MSATAICELIRLNIMRHVEFFDKSIDELETEYDKWMYFLKYVETMSDIPEIYQDDPVFVGAFEALRIDSLSPEELEEYEASLERGKIEEQMIKEVCRREKTPYWNNDPKYEAWIAEELRSWAIASQEQRKKEH